jgi:hypothetical protein
MAKQTSSSDSSLPLHEVLEAEFVALHPESPPHFSSSNEPETRLKALWSAVHALKEKQAALCISGGGIRSATFGLGILQGLARCDLLDKFHYLSTVSGGGYIGSWLSAWIKNDPDGMRGVVAKLKHRPDSPLEPEPEPIRQLREFSNYLTPKTGLMSVDFWTLIATFVRNMFLNWLVLISWLAAAMMIPKFYLAAISLQPNWANYLKYIQIMQLWNFSLNFLLALGFALVAVAMAYAIIDVPSTGNARLPQSRFLKFRELPLLLASLILAAWWAVFRNVHGSEPFQASEWLPKFVAFWIASYLSGGVLATVILSGFRKPEQKARPGRFIDSLLRIGTIVLTAAFAGFCLWAMAMRLFLFPSETEFVLKRDCETIQVPNQEEIRIPAGTKFVKSSGNAACPESPLPGASLGENEFVLKRDCKAIQIPNWEITIPACTHVLFAKEDLTDLQPVEPAPAPARHALNYVCFAPALILAVLLLVNFLFTGLASWVTEDEDREWWGRSAAWILITIFGWILVNVIVLWGAQAITATTGNQLAVFLGHVKADPTGKALLGAFGGVTGIAGALLALRHKLSNKLGEKGSLQWLLVVVAVVFFVLLAVVISWALLLIGSQPWVQYVVEQLLGEAPWQGRRLFVIFFLTGATLSFGIVMGFFINANKFSLHATYRNRLIRAYLAASRPTGTRKPNLFTGFDPKDNFELHELSPKKPLHVLNGALNLVKGQQLAWQERHAESFTMSRLHCGCLWFGYRSSAEYASGITLGTALAISGAAANPNMGYHSSPVVGFLMTLFNVRLGWWLGNPGTPGVKTWRRAGPRYSVGPLFSEAIGNTTDSYKYVNLSDGGHFENLGLYEMVLRRCHYIVVSDAGEDPECSFADLGEAIRKIRIDFGISIEFEPMTIYPRSQIDALKSAGQKGYNCAIGHIRYSEVDPVVNGKKAPDGIIIYIKPACYGDEPRDIYEYFKKSETFPHESTADQFFSESQFESYRMLGEYTIKKLCPDRVGDFSCFVREILTSHLQIEPPKWPEWLAPLISNSSERNRRHR